MAKYNLTNKAVDDLSKLWKYTCEVGSESQAGKYYELLTSSFQEIVENPAFGKNYAEIGSAVLGLHICKHIVFSRPVKASNIKIVRILHQQMDLKSPMDE